VSVSRKKPKAEPKARIISKISPDSPEARDEGPRLVPLREHQSSIHDSSFATQSRYLELADRAQKEALVIPRGPRDAPKK